MDRMKAAFEVVRNALAVEIQQEDLVAELRVGNGREDAGPVLRRDGLAGVRGAVHRGVAVPRHDEGQRRGAVLDDGAGEVVELEHGRVGDRAADGDDVALEDVRGHAQVVLPVRKDAPLDDAALEVGRAHQLVGKVVVVGDRKNEVHNWSVRKSVIGAALLVLSLAMPAAADNKPVVFTKSGMEEAALPWRFVDSPIQPVDARRVRWHVGWVEFKTPIGPVRLLYFPLMPPLNGAPGSRTRNSIPNTFPPT